MAKKVKNLKVFLYLIIMLLVAGAMISGGVILYILSPVKSPKTLEIPSGSMAAIITHLNALEPRNQFGKIDLYLMRYVGAPKAGVVELDSENLSRLEFFKALKNAKTPQKTITLIPGETTHFFLEELAQVFELDSEKLALAYNEFFHLPDGVIVAETYKLPLLKDEFALMKIIADMSYKWHKARAVEILGEYEPARWFELVAMASVIQKEAASADEMPLVASVVQNRIKQGMPLQMDGSLNYGIYSHAKVTPQRIRSDLSVYNTYKFRGIPQWPCGSVSLSAIMAAAHPAQTDYLYFVRDRATGKHTFSKTYKEHMSNF